MTNETDVALLPKIISDDQYAIILGSCSLMISVSSLFGILSNIINVTTFISMGLRDGVTVSFLFLSLFDLSFLIMSFCYGVSIGLHSLEMNYSVRFEIEPIGLFVFFGNIMILMNVTNTLTTTFIAVARCMCVARPLHFKNTFSRSRTIFFNVGFAVFASATYTPILANMGIANANMTRPMLWVSKNRNLIQLSVWVVMNALLLLTEAIIMVCIFVMANSLRTSSQFRQSSTLNCDFEKKLQIDESEKTQSSTTINTNKLAGKDLRVVQQVILISLVYIICNTPKILICIVTAALPGFSLRGGLSNIYLSSHTLQKLFEIANASVNTFIYYTYNTKFKTKLRELVKIGAADIGTV